MRREESESEGRPADRGEAERVRKSCLQGGSLKKPNERTVRCSGMKTRPVNSSLVQSNGSRPDAERAGICRQDGFPLLFCGRTTINRHSFVVISKARVIFNKARVIANEARINFNKARMVQHKARMVQHKARVSDNKARVDANSRAMDAHRARITANEALGNWNRARVGASSRAMDANRARADAGLARAAC
jgi:hypothetical protein